jgi:hypothetical protein
MSKQLRFQEEPGVQYRVALWPSFSGAYTQTQNIMLHGLECALEARSANYATTISLCRVNRYFLPLGGLTGDSGLRQ